MRLVAPPDEPRLNGVVGVAHGAGMAGGEVGAE